VNNFTSIEEKMRKIAEERNRIAQEEACLRDEAQRELSRVVAEIDLLEAQKEQLEELLGLEDTVARAEHGKIRDLCFSVLSRNSGGVTSGDIKEIIERENPGLKVSSVAATLSRQMSQGKLRRDETGKYFLS
jgi:hypothetical protein